MVFTDTKMRTIGSGMSCWFSVKQCSAAVSSVLRFHSSSSRIHVQISSTVISSRLIHRRPKEVESPLQDGRGVEQRWTEFRRNARRITSRTSLFIKQYSVATTTPFFGIVTKVIMINHLNNNRDAVKLNARLQKS